jgi:CHAD domain-containing protein
MQRELMSYGIQQLVLLHYHLSDYFRQGDAEALHQARLMFKRFSAWVSYLTLSGIDTADINENTKSLRHLFRRIGRERDLHVQIQLCQNLRSSMAPELANSLKRRLSGGCLLEEGPDEQLKEVGHAIKRVKKVCGRIDPSYYNPPFETVFARKMEYIRQLMRNAGSDLDFHRLRRLIKEAWYFLEFTGRLNDDHGAWVPMGANLKQAEQKLGAWHDAAILLENCARHMLLSPAENQAENQNMLQEIKSIKQGYMERFLDDSKELF